MRNIASANQNILRRPTQGMFMLQENQYEIDRKVIQATITSS